MLLLSVMTLFAEDIFKKGNVALGIAIGSGSIEYETLYGSVTKNYFLTGVSADVFIADNLSVGAGIMSWSGNTPSLVEYTLPVMYYFDLQNGLHPYIGAFYRYNDYSGTYSDGWATYEPGDYQAAGYKLGLAMRVSFGYIAAGLASEFDLESGDSSTYPEFVVGFMF